MLKRRALFPNTKHLLREIPDRSAEFASWQPKARPVAMPVVSLLDLASEVASEVADELRPSSAAASAHMGRIKAMRCICCQLLGRQQQSITDVHHIRETRQARNDWLTIPLCHEDCHQGSKGVHGDRTYLRQLQVGEFTLLAITLEIYVKEHVR